MPVLLQLAQSYQNPDSINYKLAYLREQTSINLGYLSFEEQVQLATLGKTVIVGGYLNTELIKAKSIVADQLNVDDLAAITAKFSGNVYVGGDLLVGGQGVLSTLLFESADATAHDWGWLGIREGPTFFRGRVQVLVSVPDKFDITAATLYLYAMPTYYTNPVYPAIGHPTKWKQSRNLRVYYSDATDGYWAYGPESGLSGVTWRTETDITNEVFGVSSWSPLLPYSGDNEANTQNKIEVKSGSVKGYITPGENIAFSVQTADEPTPANFEHNQGLGKIIIVVSGYARP